ncbi:phospholipase D-like domain-containing protein [Streptomyces heilongjiangensis]|uniref:Phospholipase D-like domain-containing protein n=1 Tax=Streptomyces heilongjiangensis TaxID=945052 RepID=A0ABW1BJI4_9ACTN|nr:phospholipase D-like domain-containing protein [Streptomyces heilongjiangensis]MDC2952643.1 phospholipase D-like domain-containing protein [Streptomyces heilongjiangensis]
MTESAVEEVVRRLSKRPGYRLATYREVGLPFWDVPIRCRLLRRKPVGVLDEFVLKCIQADLRNSADVAKFLGIPEQVVHTIMGNLVNSGSLAAVATRTSEIHYAVTEHGQKVVSDLAEITPEERTLRLAYDGLTRTYTVIDKAMRWRPRDLRQYDILEIPAFPVDPPSVGPGDTSSIGSALRGVTETSEHELLTVVALDGKREKFFVRAISLVFQSVDRPEEIHVSFAIDGRVSEEHDLAFAKAEGLRKVGIVGQIADGDSPESLLSDDLLKQRTDESEVAAIRRTTERYRAQLSALEEKAAVVSHEQREELVDQAAEVARRLDEAETALEGIPVRVLEVHEHAPLLARALLSSSSRLLIVSPWIRAAIVDKEFLDNLRKLLEAGVNVVIGYGIGDDKSAREHDRQAEKQLQRLAAEHENFTFSRLGDTHAKVLVSDDSYAVVTSFNWLSFRGDPNRPFRDERGTMITIKPEIDRLYADYLDRAKSLPGSSK